MRIILTYKFQFDGEMNEKCNFRLQWFGEINFGKKIKSNCPILYLDTVNFEPNWVERDREVAKSMVAAFMENL